MAGYVMRTIAGHKDRLLMVDKLMHEAVTLFANEQLSFEAATRSFYSLAMVSDITIPLAKQRPSKWGFNEAQVERNLAFLCVRKGNLSIARFADTCLSKFPLSHVVLPNRPLEGGPHGSDNSVYEFFAHDRGHANQGDAAIFSKLWPGFKKIKGLRNTLNHDDPNRKSIDVLLFRFFHEVIDSYETCYLPDCCKGQVQ